MSMNVSSILSALFRFRHKDCPGKRLQKYNFFLNSQAFLKKFLSFFLAPFKVNLPCNELPFPLGLGGQRYYLFPLSCKLFFILFLKAPFGSLLIIKMAFPVVSMNSLPYRLGWQRYYLYLLKSKLYFTFF